MNRSIRYIMGNCFVVWVALAAVVGAMTYWIDPSIGRDASIHKVAGHLDLLYNMLYLIGGATTVVSMLRLKVRWEIAGLSLLGSAFFINGTAIVVVHGWVGVPGGSTVTALGIACAVRVEELWRAAYKAVE